MHGRWATVLVVGWLWAASALADPILSNKPGSPLSGGAGQQQADSRGGHDRHHHHHDSYWYDPLWLVYPVPYWYYYPPVLIPPETIYGPEAVKRFLGMDSGPQVAPPARPPAEKKAPEPVPRSANPETRALAWRFITFGDLHFSNERFGEAYQRYRKAAEIIPELADAYFRQGFALVGAGRYELAAKALKRGIALDPAWPRSDFRFSDLYGGNQRAKDAHLEALAGASEKDANNADLLFLLGVCLFFDGQRDRAALFLQRAGQLAGPADHLKGFLEQVAKK